MTDHAIRLRKIRWVALLLGALSAGVMLVSAYLRLEGAGVGCADWPACYGQALGAVQAPALGGVRLLHRVTASLALVLAVFLVWQCLRPQPLPSLARPALLLLLLMLALSALGIFSADPRRVSVGFLNIMGGIGLVTLSWRVVLATAPVSQLRGGTVRPQNRLLHPGVAALTVTVMLGAWIGASYAAVACASLPHCGGVWWPPAGGWSALNPFVRLPGAALPGDPGGVTLHLLHRYSAALTLLLLGAAAVSALAHKTTTETTRNAARCVLLLLGVELALGVATIVSGLNLWLTIAHGVGAAALLAAVATLLRR
jgi:heme a synthase